MPEDQLAPAPVEQLPPFDSVFYERVRTGLTQIGEVIIPPRDARTFDVPAGHMFRIVSIEGPQVGDLNLWIDSTEYNIVEMTHHVWLVAIIDYLIEINKTSQ